MSLTFQQAKKNYKDASEAAVEAAKRYFEIGCDVEWQHGSHMRVGSVVDYAGFQFSSFDLLVKSHVSGKTIRVSTHRARKV